MAIKKYYVTNPREGFSHDRRTGKYYSWGFDVWLNGQRIQQRGYKTKETAEQVATELKERAKLDRFSIVPREEPPQLIELFQKKLDDLNQNKTERVRAKTIYTRFLGLLPHGLRVTELRQAHLQRYIDARRHDRVARTGELITAQTIRRELTPIIAALNSAGLWFGALETWRPPKTPKLKVSKRAKDRVISKAEQSAILSHMFRDREPDEDGACMRTA
jgi:hypothetical protein